MYLRLYPLLFIFLALLFVSTGCERKDPAGAKQTALAAKTGEMSLQEGRLAVIPENYEMWVNISFSADGRHVLYGAVRKGNNFVVVDNQPGKEYEDAAFMIGSADGRRFAFGGVEGGKKRLIVDNKEVKGLYHEEIAPSAFSPDGRLVASEAGGFRERQWFVVLTDGEKEVYRSKAFPDTFRQPLFSPDGRLLVFELGDDKAKTKGLKKHVFFLNVPDRKIVRERVCVDCETGSFSFSADSSRAVYDFKKGGKSFLVLNDFASHEERTAELFDSIEGTPVLSPDGKNIISILSREGKRYLVVSTWKSPAQGKETGPYETILSPVFGPDSGTAVFYALKNGKWRLVAGDAEGPSFDAVEKIPPVFSADRAKIAYSAMEESTIPDFGFRDRGVKDGKWKMVVSQAGMPAEAVQGPAYDMVVTPVFSPDGRRIAYRARKGPMEHAKRFVVIADAETGRVIKEGKAGDEIWAPAWSPDGKSIAYGARQGRELWWRVETVK